MITAENFCKAFLEQWHDDVDQGRDRLLEAYANDARWTQYMLKETGSFLSRLSARLTHLPRGPLTMGREWYTLDAVYYKEDEAVFRPGGGGLYPDCLDVIVEHENGEDVETEMWKLLMFRSPLKVLIFYDYCDEYKTTETRRIWLQGKLETLCRMHVAANEQCEEVLDVEYLFLIGNSAGESDIPAWQCGIINAHGFSGLRPLG